MNQPPNDTPTDIDSREPALARERAFALSTDHEDDPDADDIQFVAVLGGARD